MSGSAHVFTGKTGFPFSLSRAMVLSIMTRTCVAFLCLFGLLGCAPFPDIDRFGPAEGPAPVLLPIDRLLAQAVADTPDPGAALQSRAASLRARAAALDAASSVP
jgi:hypothetical protein